MSLRDFWNGQAEAWGRFARTPGRDAYHEEFNFPKFLELVPPAGRRTLDLGCGEGRVGAELQRMGHRVIGIDSSPAMVELARERHEAVVADAGALPFEDGSFDLVVAYMSVHEPGRSGGRGARGGARARAGRAVLPGDHASVRPDRTLRVGPRPEPRL